MPLMEETMSMKRTFSTLALALGLLAGAAVVGLNAACVVFDENGPHFLGGPEYKEDFLKTVPLSAGGSFSLKNTNGVVRLSTWTRDEVEIKAVKTARGSKENLDKVTIEVAATAGSVRVETVYPKLRNLRVSVAYEIKVPENARLEDVRTTNGDVDITGRLADIKAGSTNGDVRVDSAAGRCEVGTTNGDIRLINARGPVDAHTTNGGVQIDIGKVEAAISAKSTNGSITLRTAGELNAELKARTTNGRIQTDFPITIQGIVRSGRSLEGRLGTGGPLIDLHTTNGGITIGR
jgi:DUF4097 and DUF4098 domain-containing protein YvlB